MVVGLSPLSSHTSGQNTGRQTIRSEINPKGDRPYMEPCRPALRTLRQPPQRLPSINQALMRWVSDECSRILDPSPGTRKPDFRQPGEIGRGTGRSSQHLALDIPFDLPFRDCFHVFRGEFAGLVDRITG